MPLTEREKFISLVATDSPVKSDVIVLLEGDGTSRLSKCADLFKAGFAPVICFSGGADNKAYGSYPFSEYIPMLPKVGLRESDFILELKSQHTQQQAVEVLNLAEKSSWKSLILVASPYHQYRAFLTFLGEGLKRTQCPVIYNAPASNLSWFIPEPWGKRYDLLTNEFEKIEQYIKTGHCASYLEALSYFLKRDRPE